MANRPPVAVPALSRRARILIAVGVAVLVLLIVTAAQWAKADERAAAHADRTTGEPDLEAYNAMLKQMSGRH